SLAGIPMTAGFIGKFYLFAAGVDHSAWLLIGSLIINSAIGLFYYLRIVASMYAGAEEKATPMPLPGSALASLLVLMLVSGVIFWFGVYPEFLIHLIRSAIIG
ncbi:MAG: NADH-quinone oxidoreductase subunit N, partial [Candidatus Omnitrophica bacterium]|nr:NADH-quinone oxidoreductase subunit N [Candidatus Omnitrophota bacterium]